MFIAHRPALRASLLLGAKPARKTAETQPRWWRAYGALESKKEPKAINISPPMGRKPKTLLALPRLFDD
jgi:hypothetical protein